MRSYVGCVWPCAAHVRRVLTCRATRMLSLVRWMLFGPAAQISDPKNSHIVSWTQDGGGFAVHDPDAFEAHVLGKHFKHAHFASFVRQLNMYVFELCCVFILFYFICMLAVLFVVRACLLPDVCANVVFVRWGSFVRCASVAAHRLTCAQVLLPQGARRFCALAV